MKATGVRSHVDDLASFELGLRRIRKSADVLVFASRHIKEERDPFHLGLDPSAVLQREGGVTLEDFVKGMARFDADYKVVGTDVGRGGLAAYRSMRRDRSWFLSYFCSYRVQV